MKEIVVAVTGSEQEEHAYLASSVIRCLDQSTQFKVKTMTLSESELELRFSRERTPSGIPSQYGRAEYASTKLHQLKAKHGVNLLIPTRDRGIQFCADQRHLLQREGIECHVPEADQLALQESEYLGYIAWIMGFNVIDPMVSTEVLSICISGTGDGEGGSSDLITIDQASLDDRGRVVSGHTVEDARLAAAARAFVRISLWRGPFEFECKVIAGQYFLCRVGANFPSWLHFTVDHGASLMDSFLHQVLLPGPLEREPNAPSSPLLPMRMAM